MLTKLVAVTVAVIALGAAPAKADHIEMSGFQTTVDSISANPGAVTAQAVFDRATNMTKLSDEQFGKISKVASDQAQIWGDTILEGDYEADGRTIVDHVDALTGANGQLVAYRAIYSQRGWDTSTCVLDGPRTEETLKACDQGRIQEATYVSPDMMSYVRDMKQLATFLGQ